MGSRVNSLDMELDKFYMWHLKKIWEIQWRWILNGQYLWSIFYVSGTILVAVYIILHNLTKSPCKLVIVILFSQLKKICSDESSYWGMNMGAHYKLCIYNLS